MLVWTYFIKENNFWLDILLIYLRSNLGWKHDKTWCCKKNVNFLTTIWNMSAFGIFQLHRFRVHRYLGKGAINYWATVKDFIVGMGAPKWKHYMYCNCSWSQRVRLLLGPSTSHLTCEWIRFQAISEMSQKSLSRWVLGVDVNTVKCFFWLIVNKTSFIDKASTKSEARIVVWRLVDGETKSDHRLITFKASLGIFIK